MTFCAICTDERGPFTTAPLGRNDALVSVCVGCDTQRAVARCDARGYDAPKERQPCSFLPAFSRGAERVAGPAPAPQANAPMKDGTPGFTRVLVARRDAMGKSRDRNESLATLRSKPWHAELKYIGADARFHIFERPDVEGATKERNATLERGPELKRWKADRK